MQIGFYYDQSRCMGCYACIGACRSWHELDQQIPNLITIVKQEKQKPPQVGKLANLSLTHLFLACFHCAQPTCIPACPDELLVKRAEDGIVVITDPEDCTACQLCVEACPYEALKVFTGNTTNLFKCDLCVDRVSTGRPPACVTACPGKAIDVGPMEELVTKYGELRELEGFANYHQTKPSIVFRGMSPQNGGK